MELIVYTFLGKKNTNCFVAIKSDFMFNSIQSPQIFRKHCNPLIHGLNTHQQTLTIISLAKSRLWLVLSNALDA